MVRCFLTGANVPLENALVLNRRAAVDLLGTLKDRIVRLRRILDQFGPLDANEPDPDQHFKDRRASGSASAPRRHRLVCAPVADMLASGFPEISLFVAWPHYKTKVRYLGLCAKRRSYEAVDLLGELDNEAMLTRDRLGQAVLGLIDPECALAPDTRLAISVGLCLYHLRRKPEIVVRRLRAAVLNPQTKHIPGLANEDLGALRRLMAKPQE